MMVWGDIIYFILLKVVEVLVDVVIKLGYQLIYIGYGEFDGNIKFREVICDNYYKFCGINLKLEEIFVSDGVYLGIFGF